MNLMRNKIKEKINEVLKNHNHKIFFGYDFIEIEISFTKSFDTIGLEDIKKIQEQLNTELVWLRVSNDTLIVGYDISNIIIDEFSTFEIYDHYFEMNKE